MHCNTSFCWPVAVLVLFVTCGCESSDTATGDKSNSQNASTAAHSHGEDDALYWPIKIWNSDCEFRLGHHGNHFHGGDKIEPAISITRDGVAVADAKVFNCLVDPDEPETIVAEEVSTVYEPETDDEIAHYAQGELLIPNDSTKCTI